MKKNVLTILAVTGTFSVIYLLYKYKRRTVKKRDIEKAMETDTGLNNLEKENILYKVYVNDSAVVRVHSGEENFIGDISNICKNSITENINLEEGNNIMENSVATLYSVDLVVNENLESAEGNSINLTELNMTNFLNCNKNSEISSCKNMQQSINNFLTHPDLGFLDTNGEDSSDLTFLSPSIVNLESVDPVNEEVPADISRAQNGDIADETPVESFDIPNITDFNRNANVENGEPFPTPHINNSVEVKHNNLNKLNKVDNIQENLSQSVNNNEILNGESSITSVANLNGKEYSTNLNLNSENTNSALTSNSDANCDIPKVLNEQNKNDEVKQESSNGNGKKKRRRRKKKNSDSDSSSRSSSSENNGNSSPTNLNIDEILPENEICNEYFTNSSSKNNRNSPPKMELNANEIVPKNEINNLCSTNSILENNENSLTTTTLNKEEMLPKK